MTTTIGICGKGGVGKSTLSALLIGYLVEKGVRPVLAVDADPNANLGRLLGIAPEGDVGTICDHLLAETKKNPGSLSKQELLRLGLEESIAEEEGFDLITMGRPEGPGCYCYPNQVLRNIIQALASGYPAMVVDNEAGLEHLSRRLLRRLDLLIMVSSPSPRGLRTAARIHELIRELKIETKAECLVVNRGPRDSSGNLDALPPGLPLAGVIPHDPLVDAYDLEERTLLQLPAESPARLAAREIFDRVAAPLVDSFA
ncbi:MAG: AAA family ATPase [Candidatus Erginobacter occultus]|nr:AAA family ATPase [Candidatus Erginobacter occultus]